ncbi:MAG TPA: tetratricopeptide repeat protein [Candidatus Krumholzibacteria bacterium]|nr:tetratricopeptide repeat protein [Candidatus Krumholzibacteria bacterium]HRX51675.1 tetratricopeptide repeat protein [Candidatus Krumholzibacteria bacterium]
MTTRRTPLRTVVALVMLAMMLAAAVPATACDEAYEKQADHAYGIATSFLKSKDWAQAIPQLKSALELCPDHEKSLKALSKAYMATEDFEQARATLQILIEARGHDVEPGDYMDLGKAEAKLKNYPAARQAYMRAYKLDGTNCNVLFNYGMMNYAVNDFGGAVEILSQAADDCPDIRDQVIEKLAVAAQKAAEKEERLGNPDKAAYYRGIYEEQAANAGGSVGYALISERMRAKDYAGAVSAAEDFLAKNPDSKKKDKVYLNMARSQKTLGQTGGAKASFKSYLELHPEDGEIAGEMIEMLARAERCDEALAEADAAKARQAQDVHVRYARGKALECAGRYKDAQDEFAFVAANGSGELKTWATQEMRRQEQLEEIRQLKRQNAGR